MRDFLEKYVAVVEIVFAFAVFAALMFAIYMKDAVSVGTILGGIFGYMKGRSDGVAKGPLPDAGQAGRAGLNLVVFMAFMAMLAFSLLAGCTTLNVSMNTTAGDNNKPAVKTDAQADQNISPTTSATIPLK